DCNDGVSCTDDSCNEGTDSCDNVANDANCDDGQYCNGTEWCDDVADCQPGTAVDCGDGVACTDDSCNEGTDSCDNIPNDSYCDDGLFCNGAETCHATLGCQVGGDPCPGQYCDEGTDSCYECENAAECDDGLFCTGVETCVGGFCQSGSDPCPGQFCNEDTDMCEAVECLIDDDCDDGSECTVDTCVDGVCYNECAGTVSSYPYTEGWESGFGAWVNVSGDDMDWTRRSGSTPSSSTGPSSAHGGSYYVYTEASSPNYPSKTAILEGPCFDLSNTSEAGLTFWYHMYGTAMGTLNVEVSEDCVSWTNVWSLSGNQGNAWYETDVDLGAYIGSTIVIRFRGVTGSSYTSDMSVDDITVDVTPAIPCGGDPDCDDGLFCNGAETCVDSLCQPGTDPCPGQGCDEVNDQCVAGPAFADDFESGNAQGWDFYGPDSTASTGDWEIGDPVGTVSGSDQAQPENAYEGTGCVFTAQNSSLGVNDVDGGVVYLVSPTIDLSGASSTELTYVRWFYNRDLGEDSGDFFVAEVSANDGATWVNLETLNTNQSANTWTPRSFMLEDFITLTGTVRLRFGAADGSSLGNIIEAAIDNVEVWKY
ncbi:MAG: choice-of-anchor J domain-containing protein, partial [Phycisphaerales bacterium]